MTRQPSAAAQIVAGLNSMNALTQRACDALDDLTDEQLNSWGARSSAYLLAETISNADFIALTKDDAAAVAAQKQKRVAK